MPEIIKSRIRVLKNNLKPLIIAVVFYLSGVVIGVICHKNGCGGVFFKEVCNYYNRIFDRSASVLSTFFLRLAVNFGYTAIVFSLSFTLFTYPLILPLLAYRGAIIGAICGIFISLYGFNGGAVFFTVTLPQNILVTFGLIIAGTLNFDHVLKNCKKIGAGEFLTNCLIGFIITVLGAVYELLISFLLIRPMNFYF